MIMSLEDWTKAIHENAKKHGWWDDPRTFGEIIALCHSELSEALEAYRDGEDLVWFKAEDSKPEGPAVEMADCIIRILDWFGCHPDLDVEKIIAVKHSYNQGRPYKHGGKRI